MNFFPGTGYVEVEPLTTNSGLVSDERNFTEKARVIRDYGDLHEGDIIFFRSHGFFELAEHEDKKRYVVRVSEEFILGIIKNVAEK